MTMVSVASVEGRIVRVWIFWEPVRPPLRVRGGSGGNGERG